MEKVYENALFYELKEIGFSVDRQKRIEVFYNKIPVGIYNADLVVDDKIIIEIKAADGLCEENEFQLINYLKATNLEVGLLFNLAKNPNSGARYSLIIKKSRNADDADSV